MFGQLTSWVVQLVWTAYCMGSATGVDSLCMSSATGVDSSLFGYCK